MAIIKLRDGARVSLERCGTGSPVIFLHGVAMSSRFFSRQEDYFSTKYDAIFLDFRGHGQSADVVTGHTVPNYARDVHDIIKQLDLHQVTLVGWSMGAFVIWDYLSQFGGDNISSTVVVDEFASDFKWPDFEFGFADISLLSSMVELIQTDYPAMVEQLIHLMFKDRPSEKDLAWIRHEISSITPSNASTMLFDQSVRDYRSILPNITTSTLICAGRDEKLVPVAAAHDLASRLANARVEVFENSGHCPFWEEADKFNAVVDAFAQSHKT